MFHQSSLGFASTNVVVRACVRFLFLLAYAPAVAPVWKRCACVCVVCRLFMLCELGSETLHPAEETTGAKCSTDCSDTGSVITCKYRTER